MYFIIYIAITTGIAIIYRTKITSTYTDLKKLTNAVAQRHTSRRAIMCNTLDILRKKLWFTFLQTINNSITRIDKNTSIMTYTLDGRLYKTVLDHRKGPSVVLLVTDENGEDVTTDVVPFLGPKRDWHKREFTPKFWKKDMLEFSLSNGETKEFGAEEVIDLRNKNLL
jgi:hypothetical protein